MCLSAYSHFAIKDGMDKMTSEFIFGMLLACRFIVRLQVQARENSVEEPSEQRLENGETVADAFVQAGADKKTDWIFSFNTHVCLLFMCSIQYIFAIIGNVS